MGLLVDNAPTDPYEGDRFAVPRELFEAYVAELVEGGPSEAEACALLLGEAEWSDDVKGVQLLGTPALCLHCRGLLEPPRSHFCDAASQASFYAKAHS